MKKTNRKISKHWAAQLLLMEEQTLLARERTMQQYMTTGLAFITVGLLVLRFFEQNFMVIGIILILIGFWQLWQAYLRFKHYRALVKNIREKEKKLKLEVGE